MPAPLTAFPSLDELAALLSSGTELGQYSASLSAAIDDALNDGTLPEPVRVLLRAAGARLKEGGNSPSLRSEVRVLIDAARRRVALRDRVTAHIATMPAAPVPAASDDDAALQADFIAESRTLVRAAERALTSQGAGRDEVNAALRAFHTIKGTSSVLARENITRLAHLAEGVLVRVRDDALTLDEPRLHALVCACRRLNELLDAMQADPDGPVGSPEGDAVLSDLERAARSDLAPSETCPAAPIVSGHAEEASFRHAPRNSPTLSAMLGARAPDATTRVQTDRLDHVAELVDALGACLSGAGHQDWRPGAVHLVQELRRATSAVRCVPLRGPLHRVRRVVREVTAHTGKRASFVVEGDDHEVDCGVAEVIGEALVHLARNAVDHGIETPQERGAVGKSETGILLLRAIRDGDHLVIEFSDDGRGLERERLVTTAAARGLALPSTHEGLTDSAIWDLVFAPGFSTAREVTELSGRGVGLDVVRKSAESLGGSADVRSRPGMGTTFVLRLPAANRSHPPTL